MANNIAVTEGSGKSVATEDISSVQYQKIKLIDGTPGSTTPVGTASNPLNVTMPSATLPTGAATSMKQDTGNSSLASIDTKVSDVATQTTLALIKAKTDNLDTALSGIKTGTDKIPSSPSQEHTTAVSPSSVRLTDGSAFYKATTPSDTQPISASSLPLPTGAATETTLGTRLSESDFDTKIGALTETAPGTDTASSGLNGRLQRIAQRITSLITLLPTALTGSGNFKVAVQESLPSGSAVVGKVGIDQTTPGTTNKVSIGTDGTVAINTAIPVGNNNIGDVDVVTVPTDPFGANADAASATGSISAKLRYLAGTGIAGMTTLPTGSNAIGKLAANSGVDIGDVDVISLPSTPTGTNSIGKVIPEASASGVGLSTYKNDALVATAVAVKAGAGRVYGYHIYNSNTVDIFMHFYDIAQGSVTVGSSARARTLCIPAGGVIDTTFALPLTLATAITVAATTTITGNTAPSTGLLVNIDYL